MAGGQGESTRKMVTLLWLLINLGVIGFLFTTFFVGGHIPLAICLEPVPTHGGTNPPANVTASPTTATMSPTPLGANATFVPTSSPTLKPNQTDEDASYYDDGNSGFVMMWSTFLLVSLSVGGTMVLKSSRTPFAIGGFAGVVLVMANLMFLLSATFAGELRRRATLGVASSADEAILAFCIIEFFLLTAFSIVLIRNKDDILEIKQAPDEVMDSRSYEAAAVQGVRGI